MAITRQENQVTWPTAANSKSVSSGSNETSEEITLNATCVKARIHMKADNAGTPAAGDTLDVYVIETGGDPDGTGSDEFDSVGHARWLCQLDTNVEDAALKSAVFPVPQKGAKLYVENNAASNSITVSATITEQRAA